MGQLATLCRPSTLPDPSCLNPQQFNPMEPIRTAQPIYGGFPYFSAQNPESFRQTDSGLWYNSGGSRLPAGRNSPKQSDTKEINRDADSRNNPGRSWESLR